MQTLTRPPAAAALLADQDARAAWRRRVAYAGSLFQLAFAALWLVRGTLAAGWPARLPIAIALAAVAAVPAFWAPWPPSAWHRSRAGGRRPPGPGDHHRHCRTARGEHRAAVRSSARWAADLAVTSIAITIATLLRWRRARLPPPTIAAAGACSSPPVRPRPGADREHPHRRHRAGDRRHPPGQRHHRIPRPGQRHPHHPGTRQPAPGTRPAGGSRPRGCRGIRTAPGS